MNRITCEECGREGLSQSATVCPACGKIPKAFKCPRCGVIVSNSGMGHVNCIRCEAALLALKNKLLEGSCLFCSQQLHPSMKPNRGEQRLALEFKTTQQTDSCERVICVWGIRLGSVNYCTYIGACPTCGHPAHWYDCIVCKQTYFGTPIRIEWFEDCIYKTWNGLKGNACNYSSDKGTIHCAFRCCSGCVAAAENLVQESKREASNWTKKILSYSGFMHSGCMFALTFTLGGAFSIIAVCYLIM